MIKAVFEKKYFWNIFCLVCGLFLIVLFVFVGYKDPEAIISDVLSGVIFGTNMCLFSIICLLFNFKAYLYIENGYIKGKYHYFGKISCSISDVEFASAQINTLIIQLKDGKCHTIMGIINPRLLSSAIRRNMAFEASEQPEKLMKKLSILKSSRKKNIILVCFLVALMFINIFAAVFLTDGKDLAECNNAERSVITVMGIIEIATTVITFYFAQKARKKIVSIEKLTYFLQKALIETEPLLPGNAKKVFADENYIWRVTVFGYPNADSAYYSVEKLAPNFVLVNVETSEIYDNIEDLPDWSENLIDITEKILH